MAKPHKFAWNGIDVETSLSIEQLGNMAQRAAMDSTGDLIHGKQRIASTRSSDRQIEFRINDFLISFKKFMVFYLDFEQRGGRTWMSSRIDWYVTSQHTVGGFIPVSTKSMVAHHTYMEFVRNLAAQVRAADPQARVTIREGAAPASVSSASADAAGPASPEPSAPPSTPAVAGAASPVPETPAAWTPPPPVPIGDGVPPPPPPSVPIPPPPPPPPPPVYAAPSSAAPSPPARSAGASAGGLVTGVPGMPQRDASPPSREPEPTGGVFASFAEQMFAEDEDLDATRIAQRGPGAQPWFLRLPGQRELDLATPVVVGRNPVPPGNAAEAIRFPLEDPARSVSKTHALVEIRDGMPWITDLHSTNGTTVTNRVGEALVCEPGTAIPVGDGWRIGFGELTVLVSRRG